MCNIWMQSDVQFQNENSPIRSPFSLKTCTITSIIQFAFSALSNPPKPCCTASCKTVQPFKTNRTASTKMSPPSAMLNFTIIYEYPLSNAGSSKSLASRVQQWVVFFCFVFLLFLRNWGVCGVSNADLSIVNIIWLNPGTIKADYFTESKLLGELGLRQVIKVRRTLLISYVSFLCLMHKPY